MFKESSLPSGCYKSHVLLMVQMYDLKVVNLAVFVILIEDIIFVRVN